MASTSVHSGIKYSKLIIISTVFCNVLLSLYGAANIYSVFAYLCGLPRSLCVDALIELSDENADWKLSFDEFLNCLKPGFNPPEKSELKVIVCIL